MRRDEALLAVAKLTTEDRNQTHGDPIPQFETAQQLKNELARGPHWMDLNAVEREVFEMICTKLSRAVHGKVYTVDHLLDIIGYSAIGIESRHEQETKNFIDASGILRDSQGRVIADDGAAAIAARFAPRTPAERATRD